MISTGSIATTVEGLGSAQHRPRALFLVSVVALFIPSIFIRSHDRHAAKAYLEGEGARHPRPWLEPEVNLRDYVFLRERVMDEHDWTFQKAEEAVVEYLRFMQMLAEAPEMELIASMDVDLVWHEHLLDTQNYVLDCMSLYGRFLHHRRARTAEEMADIPAAYARTKKRYLHRFGIAPSASIWGSAMASSMCGGGGGSSSRVADSGPASPGPAPTLQPEDRDGGSSGGGGSDSGGGDSGAGDTEVAPVTVTVGDYNRSVCPTGYIHVFDETECRQAAEGIGATSVVVGNWSVVPRGCSLNIDQTSVWLNTHPAGAATSDFASVCASQNVESVSTSAAAAPCSGVQCEEAASHAARPTPTQTATSTPRITSTTSFSGMGVSISSPAEDSHARVEANASDNRLDVAVTSLATRAACASLSVASFCIAAAHRPAA